MNAFLRAVSGLLLAFAGLTTLGGGWGDVREAVAEQLTARGPERGEEGGAALVGSVVTRTDRLALPTRISVQGDELLVVDRYARHGLMSFDRVTGAVRRAFGPGGKGPRELAGPTTAFTDGSRTGVYQAGLNRVTWLDHRESDHDFRFLSVQSLLLESTAMEVQPTADGGLLAAGFFGDSRLALLGADGRKIRTIGQLAMDPDLPMRRQTEVYQGTLRASAARDRFVLTSRFAAKLEVWAGDLSSEMTFRGPEPFEPKTGSYVSRFGYLDSAPAQAGVLALYSGRTREDYPDRANFGDEIHEFTWDGRLVGRHHLDSDLLSIAWDEERQVLYGIRHDPVPAVVAYRLPTRMAER